MCYQVCSSIQDDFTAKSVNAIVFEISVIIRIIILCIMINLLCML